MSWRLGRLINITRVHCPCTRVSNTDVILDTRVCGLWLWLPVHTACEHGMVLAGHVYGCTQPSFDRPWTEAMLTAMNTDLSCVPSTRVHGCCRQKHCMTMLLPTGSVDTGTRYSLPNTMVVARWQGLCTWVSFWRPMNTGRVDSPWIWVACTKHPHWSAIIDSDVIIFFQLADRLQ